ncbi:hypothetical protein HPB48_000672 [Haemaphysalis longicornis]|uniref:Carboxylesterase type B domain-containing protein n=1 Tax=Haemaphysalis longicornis TaxID=44386 RepID=A0A9J6GPX5_HAELO|nr:hypothetical protein HPB48_000672 [Haemaphysalis longicornis]
MVAGMPNIDAGALITAVAARPALWQAKHKDDKNKPRKQTLWDEVEPWRLVLRTEPDESHRLSPHPDTTGHGCPSDPEPPRPDPVDATREPEQPNAADNVGSPARSPSDYGVPSVTLRSANVAKHKGQSQVKPIHEHEGDGVPSGRETEPSVMDKALERHIVSHGSGGASSKRPNNLALYAVLLVIALILLAFAVYFAIFKKAHLSVVVDAPWGKYRGKYKPVEGLSCYSFLGIPFANGGAPRFGLPQRPGPGAFQETSGSAPCLQQPLRLGNFAVFDAPRGTEDCLRLNLWTPSIEYKLNGSTTLNFSLISFTQHLTISNKKKLLTRHLGFLQGLAVLVFFLGFEFYYGGNSQESLSGEYLSALGDLVVVVPNYRLGPLGFLNAKLSDAPGNQALYDQRHALDWVRENVRFFGGDPARIVLHGYEAGAVSIGYQLMSPLDHWVKSVPRYVRTALDYCIAFDDCTFYTWFYWVVILVIKWNLI